MKVKSILNSYLVVALISILACTDDQSAQQIVDEAIQAAGVLAMENARASFDFRNKHYRYERANGAFKHLRIQQDSSGSEIKDVYTNEGLIRYINNVQTEITEERQNAFANSVNSVMYFAFLPLRLNDDAVNKSYVGQKTIKGTDYHKVQVTFDQEGGGKDFEDVFYYWFDVEDHSMDFLAYSYKTDDGGMRFREAFNVRAVNGVTIQDYRNFKPIKKGSVPVQQLDEAFENQQLTLLSTIQLENMIIEK